MPATAPAPEPIDDPIADLAVLLKRWRLKPKRGARWLHDFWQAFEKHEPAACARYQRVATLGVETAALLDLSPPSQAAIRGSALLSSLTVAATNSAPEPGKRTRGARSLEKELREWRWLQVSAGVVQGLQASLDTSQASAQHSGSSIEARILAVAEDFEELTAGRGGVLRGLHALRDGSRRQHDQRLLDLLWSEDGQAVCDRVLRRRGTHRERAVKELQESAQLLEATKSGPPQPVRRQTTTHLQVAAPPEPAAPPEREARPTDVEEPGESGTAQPGGRETAARLQEKATASSEPSPLSERGGGPKEVEKKREERGRLLEQVRSGPAQPVRQETPARPQDKTTAPAEPASAAEGAARPKEVEERREDMSKTAANEEQSTKTRHREDGDSASLTARVAAAARELEEIRAAASRGLEALASVGPAMEELSSLVSRLQASLLPAQGGNDAAQPRQQPNDPRSIALRVERAKGDLDAAEVVDALDALRDLRDVRVREEGSSWAVLRARTDPDTDLSILQAKIAGSLTRRLRGEDDDEAVEVTILEGT